MAKYKGITIPTPLYEYVKELIEDRRVIERYGFSSVSEFAKRAMEKLIKEVRIEILER